MLQQREQPKLAVFDKFEFLQNHFDRDFEALIELEKIKGEIGRKYRIGFEAHLQNVPVLKIHAHFLSGSKIEKIEKKSEICQKIGEIIRGYFQV